MAELREVFGGSMWPLLRSGDRVLIRRVRARGLRPGDVVAYREHGRLVCHRLVRTAAAQDGLELLCRGDACPGQALEAVPERRFEGKVVAVARGNELLQVQPGHPALRTLRRWAERLRLALRHP